MKHEKLLITCTLGALLLSCAPALAATPQEILNKNIKMLDSNKGYQLGGEFNILVKEIFNKRQVVNGPETADIAMNFNQRMLDKNGDYRDGQGSFEISKAKISSDDTDFYLDQPIKFEWRAVGKNAYFKINQLPKALNQGLINIGIDLSNYTQQWFFTPRSKDTVAEVLFTQLPGIDTLKLDIFMSSLSDLADKQLLTIKKIEKTFLNVKNEKIVRVRLIINRSLLYKEFLKELTAAHKIKVYADRVAAIKKARTEYQKALKQAAALHLAANINLDKQKLEKLEFGLMQSDPKQSCEYNFKTDKDVCKTIGKTKVTVTGGVWFGDLDTTPITIPYNAQSIDALFQTSASSSIEYTTSSKISM